MRGVTCVAADPSRGAEGPLKLRVATSHLESFVPDDNGSRLRRAQLKDVRWSLSQRPSSRC